MTKKAAKKKARPQKVNKTKEIKNYIQQHAGALPTEVVAALAKRGITVKPGYVSTIKYELKRRNGGGLRGGKKGVTLDGLKSAKAFAEDCGGIENARQVLNAYAELAT